MQLQNVVNSPKLVCERRFSVSAIPARVEKMLRAMLAMSVMCVGLMASSAHGQLLQKVFSPVKQIAQKCVGANCQSQSVQSSTENGSVVVGQREPDGAVVTSVGPVVDVVPSAPFSWYAETGAAYWDYSTGLPRAQAPTPAPPLPQQTVIAGASRSDFRTALMDAAAQELRAGNLKPREFLTLAVESLNHKRAEEVRIGVTALAVQEGAITEGDVAKGFDWQKVLAFLLAHLPEIIDLFTKKTT